MHKPFWLKLITSILAGMFLINGILPTKVVLADDPNYGYNDFDCTEDGTYLLGYDNGYGKKVIDGFGNNGIEDIYYYKGDVKVAPESDGNGRVELFAGEKYYFKKQYLLFSGVVNEDKAYNLQNIKDVPNLDAMLAEGKGDKADESGFHTMEGDKLLQSIHDDNASFIESVITKFLMLIGRGFYTVLCFVIGEPFSIENVIFNKYTNTRLAFFTNDVTGVDSDNNFISESGIRDVLNRFFKMFTGIAIVVYLIILVYMGIRILLGSTAEKGSRYKELILYWLEGVLILFLFPYIMKYSIQVNNAFVSFLYENKNEYISIMDNQPVAQPDSGNFDNFIEKLEAIDKQLQSNSDYMSIMYKKAVTDEWLVYAICWWAMFFQLIGFLVVYFKRVLVTMFLIAIFPLVMISYAIDKIGDAKSQAFDNWIKEFMLNVFVQSFHAITYVLIMSILSMLMTDPSDNWLLMLIALSFVSKGDDILRGLFSLKGSADSVKGVGASFAKTMAMTNAIKTVRGVKGAITNPKGLGMKVYNRASQLDQKAWNHVDDRVSRTAAKLELDKFQATPTDPLNGNPLQMATKQEIENDINDSVNILLGKKEGGATNDEIRNAADKLTGYLNQTDNADVQETLDNIAGNLSDEERKTLDNLLMQNAHINALMVGGREINIRQNIDLILSLLQKDANGNFTPESLAILNKIASSEDELKAMKLFGGGIKFNKKNVIEVNQNKSNSNRVGNNPYFRERELENIKRFKGRGKAKDNKITNKDAKSELDAIMKSTGTLTNYSAKSTNASKKAKRTVRRTAKPGQERAGSKINKETKQYRVQMSAAAKKKASKFKNLKRSRKPWQNIESVNGSAGLETAKFGAAAKYKVSKKSVNPAVQSSRAEKIKDPIERVVKYTPSRTIPDKAKSNTSTTDYGGKVPEKKTLKIKPDTERVTVREMKQKKEDARKFAMEQKQQNSEKKHSFTPGSGAFAIKRNVENQRKANQEKKAQTIDMPSSNPMSSNRASGGSAQNAGADIASRQGSAEALQDILNTKTPQESRIITPKFSERDVKNGQNLFNYFAYGDIKGYNQDKNRRLANHLAFDTPKGYASDDVNISKQSQKDLENLGSAISVLTQADGGYYTAKELLDNIKYVQDFAKKYEDATGDEKFVLDKMINFLDCRPEDYEAYLRVKILNDPDSVGNDRKIIEECKDYVKNTPMLSVIKDRLGYNMEDLVEGKNLKHVNSRNTEYDGIVSEEHRARVQEKYENELQKYELETKIAQLDKKIADNYNIKSYAKDVGNLVVDAAKFGVDMQLSVGVGLGTGLMASGMGVDGKQETLSQATEQILAGFSAENKIYSAIKNDISGIYNGGKEFVSNNFAINEKQKKMDNNPIKEYTRPKDYDARVNELKDKTTVKSPLFGNRGKNDKK